MPTINAEVVQGPRPKKANPTKNATKPAAETLEKPKRGRKMLVRITPNVLKKYWEVKKKPAWASVRDQCCEKEGKIGPSNVVMIPMRTKLR